MSIKEQKNIRFVFELSNIRTFFRYSIRCDICKFAAIINKYRSNIFRLSSAAKLVPDDLLIRLTTKEITIAKLLLRYILCIHLHGHRSVGDAGERGGTRPPTFHRGGTV